MVEGGLILLPHTRLLPVHLQPGIRRTHWHKIEWASFVANENAFSDGFYSYAHTVTLSRTCTKKNTHSAMGKILCGLQG